jgi:TonB family protein
MPKRVLLIDYEPRYVERVRQLLGPLEHTITEAHDGEAGLAAFGGSKFDLVLLSGMLPRLPSAEVIREIRKKGGATAPPIILMMSGYRGDNRKADAQKVGAFDILARPFTDQDFLGTVREALELSDIGAKTMRIDTTELATASASPLTSSDIFSDLLNELVEPSARIAPRRPAPPPVPPTPPAPPSVPAAAPAPQAPPTPRAAASAESEIEKRLRDTLSGLNLGAKPSARPEATPPPPAAPPRPKLSSDTDVDKILSDTLSGFQLPKPKTHSGVTPAPGATSSPAPRRREEPAAAVPSSGPDRFGQYEILERIASGGMAELYKAKRTGVEGFQKIVAIKKILPHLADDEEFITMFADEAKLAAQLNHPNIIHIYDLGKIQAGGYFIAMEYVDGRDLRAIQKSGRELGVPLPVPLAVYIASKVASALDYAHRRRDAEGNDLHIVHRDVSPQNILISYEGDIKLCDFGIAKAASKASQTQSGALKGKLQYMSPEQAWAKPIDRRSDLFSLGVVLHELLTGDRLFRADTDIQTLEKVRSAEVAPPSRLNPEVPRNLDSLVLRALAKDPEDRYANASDLLRELDSVLYSYTPAPGSADVAIYLHRLQAEETAVAEARAREAAAQAQIQSAPEEPARRRKSKSVPVRRTGSTPKAPAPEPPPPPPPSRPARPSAEPAPEPPSQPPSASSGEIFGSRAARALEAERRSRTPLYVAIGVAAAALAGFAIWKMAKTQAAPTPVVVPTKAPAVVVATEVPAQAPAPTAAPLDPKAVEAEVQRQLAAKRKELEKAAAAAPAPAAKKQQETAAPEPTAPPPTEAPPTPVPTYRPEPTAVPTEPPAAEAPAPVPQTQRGDLVGPGAGVVEPVLISAPRVVYPPMAKQRGIAGRVVVLVQVDENGKVVEARLQQGIAGQDQINSAVVAAVRNAKFQPATKNGIPVRMWRPVVVEVKP